MGWVVCMGLDARRMVSHTTDASAGGSARLSVQETEVPTGKTSWERTADLPYLIADDAPAVDKRRVLLSHAVPVVDQLKTGLTPRQHTRGRAHRGCNPYTPLSRAGNAAHPTCKQLKKKRRVQEKAKGTEQNRTSDFSSCSSS